MKKTKYLSIFTGSSGRVVQCSEGKVEKLVCGISLLSDAGIPQPYKSEFHTPEITNSCSMYFDRELMREMYDC